MASFALRLRPQLRHLIRFLSTSRQTESGPLHKMKYGPRFISAIRSESDPDRLASLFLSASDDRSLHRDWNLYNNTIQRLAASDRPDLIRSLLSSSVSSFPSPSEDFLIPILKLYSRHQMLDDAVDTFYRIKPITNNSFSALLSAFLENNQFERLQNAFYILPIKLGFTPKIQSYNTFLKCLILQGKNSTAREVLDEMPQKGIEPDIAIYNKIFNVYLKKDDEQSFNELLKLLYSQGLRPNSTTYDYRIRLLCNKGRSFEALELLKTMIFKQIHPKIETFNTLIGVFCKEGEINSAMHVYNRIKESKKEDGTSDTTPNYETYNMMISSLVENCVYIKATELCREGLEMKWIPRLETVKRLAEGLIKRSEMEMAMELVEDMSNIVEGNNAVEWKKIEAEFSF